MESQIEHEIIHVVIGIIKNSKNEVLVSKRRSNAHLGGLLEFPGGKVNSGENNADALKREMREELNVQLHNFSPLIQVPYTYSDRNVLLDVFTINEYSGTIIPNESQKIYWKKISTLNCGKFPSANHGVIRALQLPKLISVTPDYSKNSDNFIRYFEKTVANKDVFIIQLRLHDLGKSEYIELAKKCFALCEQHHTKLVLNQDVSNLNSFSASGLHLTSKRLLATSNRPLCDDYLVSASCHNEDEIHHASKLKLDYILLGPVLEKDSNLNDVLGWERFKRLSQKSEIPVYAIGGLCVADVETSVKNGGQGIAAIRDLWMAD